MNSLREINQSNPVASLDENMLDGITTNVDRKTSNKESDEDEDDDDDIDDKKYNAYKEKQKQNESDSKSNENVRCDWAGLFPCLNDCTKFYECIDSSDEVETNVKWSVIQYECPSQTIFNRERETCDFPEDIYPPQDCPVAYGTDGSNGESVDENRPTETVADEDDDDKTTKANEPNEICPSAGFFVHPDDCSEYYQCIQGNDGSFLVNQYGCPSGTVWDSEQNFCNPPEGVQIQNCRNLIYEDDEDKEEEDDNEDMSDMDLDISDFGVDNIDLDSVEMDDDETATATGFICPFDGIFSDSTDCQRYILCSEDFNVTLTCPPHKVYDNSTRKCSEDLSSCPETPECPETSDDQRLADPNNDKYYYICSITGYSPDPTFKVLKNRCPEFLIFDQSKQKCVPKSVTPNKR